MPEAQVGWPPADLSGFESMAILGVGMFEALFSEFELPP
jgi:hypothetical protein